MYQHSGYQEPPIGYPTAPGAPVAAAPAVGYPTYGQPPPATYAAAPLPKGAAPPVYGVTPGMGYGPVPDGMGVPVATGGMGQPPQEPIGVGLQGERFARTGWRDMPWAILFWVHLLVVIVLGIVGGSKLRSMPPPPPGPTPGPAPQAWAWQFAEMVALDFGVSLVFSIVWLLLMKRFPTAMIWTSLIFAVLAQVALAIFFFAIRAVALGVIMIVLAALSALAIFFWRNRVAFSALLLSTGVGIVNNYPATTLLAFVSVLVQILYLVPWSFAMWASGSTQGGFYALVVFLVLSFYWTSQVVMNNVHTTVAGTAASWYFTPNPDNPTLHSLKRSLTTSFGSICLGSFIVAVIKTLRFMVNSLRSNNPRNLAAVVFACCANCLLGCLDRLMRYFNKYAFVQVAIYGKPYCEAARDTMEMFGRRGIEAIINDSLVEPVLNLGALICGVLAGIAGVLLAQATVPVGAAAVTSFLIGFVICAIVLNVVDSAVTTIFVCYAEDPTRLQQFRPELYAAFATTDARV